MKPLFRHALIAVGVCSGSPVFAQVAGNTPVTEQNQRPLTPPKGNLTVDEYAVALANAADENIIMDATDVPADTRIPQYPTKVPRDWAPIFYSVLEDFRGNTGVTIEKLGGTTLLRYAPDALPFARAIIASGTLQNKQPLEDVNPLNQDLYEYAQKQKGWKAETPRLALNIKVSELPEPLRERVLRLGRQQILVGTEDYALWLSDDFWNKGTGLLRPGKMSGTPDKLAPQIEIASNGTKKTPQFYEVTYYSVQPSNLTNAYIAQIYKR